MRIKILPTTWHSDLRVDLRNPKATYNLVEGQQIRVRFTLNALGNCFLLSVGDDGVIL